MVQRIRKSGVCGVAPHLPPTADRICGAMGPRDKHEDDTESWWGSRHTSMSSRGLVPGTHRATSPERDVCGQTPPSSHSNLWRSSRPQEQAQVQERHLAMPRLSRITAKPPSRQPPLRTSSRMENVSRPVSRVLSGGYPPRRPFIWDDARASPRATNPGDCLNQARRHGFPHARSPLFGLAPGGVCPAASVASRAVRSYRTISPLPRLAEAGHGGLISVALSLGLPPAAVSRHRWSMEPGLSSTTS